MTMPRLSLSLLALAISIRFAAAQDTTFSYQGVLSDGGNPANGLYDLQFTLFGSSTAGSPVTGPLTNAPTAVSNGLFSVILDFGASAFIGPNRWLEIGVRTNGSADPYMSLVPRQPLTPTPYALHAVNAANLMSFVNAPLDIKINGLRALRLEPNATSPNIIGGSGSNVVTSGVVGGTIAGGGRSMGFENRVGANFGTVGGGVINIVDGESGTVGGGSANSVGAGANRSTVAGGGGNNVWQDAVESFIGGGGENDIRMGASFSVIAGGKENTVNDGAINATVGGGYSNHIEPNATNSVIAGGFDNRILAGTRSATISGGELNVIGGDRAIIGGGIGNEIDPGAYNSYLGGGSDNHILAGAFHSTIAGGGENTIEDSAFYSAIGGGLENIVRPNAISSTIAGGFHNQIEANATNSSVGGGNFNIIGAGSENTTIGGGGFNRASGIGATVAGGGGFYGGEASGNVAEGDGSTVGGGLNNRATAIFSTIVGGEANNAEGRYATAAGGLANQAVGDLSFAAGNNTVAAHEGAFVWSDASFGSVLYSTAPNQFTARASGGVRFFTDTNATTGAELAPGSGTWSSLSDRNTKENFAVVAGTEILDKVAALPLASWNYKAQDRSIRHLGPTAQDFHAAFGLGESERTISGVDADGVALAAIQGLNQKLEAQVKAKEIRITELEKRLEKLESFFAARRENGSLK
jgi:hypothetical protein